MRFDTEKALQEAITERVNAWSVIRLQWANRIGVDCCYYLGIQTLTGTPGYTSTTLGRVLTNTNPDSGKLRVVWNKLTQCVIKSRAATWPEQIETTVEPPIRDGGVSASVYSQVHEDLQTAWMKKVKFKNVARLCNNMRSTAGAWGIGLTMKTGVRMLMPDGAEGPMKMADRRLGVEDFSPLQLVLDSAMPHRDLNQHEWVVRENVWTETQIQQAFPDMVIEKRDLRPIRDIAPFETQLCYLTDGQLFPFYGKYSSTLGAKVYQFYIKDDSDRWSTIYTVVALGNEWKCPNLKNPQSPFGSQNHIPINLLHGHERPMSPCSISDVRMAKDPQDIVNLTITNWMRAFQKNAHAQWRVDKRWMGSRVSDEDARNVFTNNVYGVIMGNPVSSDRNVAPPELVEHPPPPQYALQMAEMAGEQLQRNTFRTDLDSGLGIKTHTPDKSLARAEINSGQVLGIRVAEDRDVYASILDVADGTLCAGIQAGAPTPLQMVREEGFDEQDIAVILQSDPMYPTCGTVVSESSIRYRSHEEKRATMLELATAANPMMNESEVRRGMAALDMAASDDDEYMQVSINKAVKLLIQGQPWRPLMLGKYNDWCLNTLRRALFDREAQRNPMILQSIEQAIMAQRQIAVQEAIEADPSLMAQQQQATQQQNADMQMAQMEAQQPQEGEQAQPENIGQLVDMLSQPAA